MKLLGDVKAGATFSDDMIYRYSLTRDWDESLPRVLWVMLNPSTASHLEDDPTVRKCQGYARRWGYGAITVCNIFALRSTDPRGLKQAHERGVDPRGLYNWDTIHLRAVDRRTALVVAAWGAHGAFLTQGPRVATHLRRLVAKKLHVLGLTKDGHPRHPLYLPNAVEPIPWSPA